MKEIKKEKIRKRQLHMTLHLVTILLLLLLIILWFSRCAAPQPVVSRYEQKVDEITEIESPGQQEALNTIVEEGQMNVNYLSEAVFDGKVSESFHIKNIKNNHYPIVFELYDEQGERLYQSGKINPGYEMTCVELDQELARGTHDCKLKVGYAEAGNVSSVFPITIEVQ